MAGMVVGGQWLTPRSRPLPGILGVYLRCVSTPDPGPELWVLRAGRHPANALHIIYNVSSLLALVVPDTQTPVPWCPGHLLVVSSLSTSASASSVAISPTFSWPSYHAPSDNEPVMSTKLVAAASRALDTRTSRRGFLRRAAMVGTALVAAPPPSCFAPEAPMGRSFPANAVPGPRATTGGPSSVATSPESTPALRGTWSPAGGGPKATRSATGTAATTWTATRPVAACSCGGSGTCAHTCVDLRCHCNHDNCGERKTCCTRFRYGQCNNQKACIGPITCRVVTCVPPWEWDSSCSHTSAVSQSTYNQSAAGLLPDTTPKGPYPAGPAVFAGPTWQLRNSVTSRRGQTKRSTSAHLATSPSPETSPIPGCGPSGW